MARSARAPMYPARYISRQLVPTAHATGRIWGVFHVTTVSFA